MMRDSESFGLTPPLTRRELLLGASAAGFIVAVGRGSQAREPAIPTDHTIRIEPVTLELAPGKSIKTTGYNGTVPGPVLRLKENKPVAIKVINDSGYPNLIHWHGLMIPSVQDGAMEEGSPLISAGESLVYRYTPRPAGTRWYHSHATAGPNLARSTYTGEYGFLLVEPAAGDPGSYDREVLLAAHHWEGSWVSMQDLRKGPRPTTGSRSCTERRPWGIDCWGTASRFAFGRVSGFCFAS